MTTNAGSVASTATDDVEVDAPALDAIIEDLAAHATLWADVGATQRAQILSRVLADTVAVADEWNAAACAAKGLDPQGPDGAEELFSGVGTFVRMAAALRDSMLDLAREGRPHYPGPVTHRGGGRLSVGVLPATVFDRILFPGVSAEVWMKPGVDEARVRATQAATYQDPHAHEGVALVLGAGNVASLGPRDALSKLFADGEVVLVKANPVNEYLVPYWERALRALIAPGFLRIVRGGARVGAYLSAHPGLRSVHVTGSDKTFDAIVFGTGEEGARRKAADEPRLRTPVTGELGNVSPVIIVPGEWSEKELRYQARHVATMLVNNAGFNCLTPRVIVTHRSWPQRDAFLSALAEVLARIPTRRAYYPGARARADLVLAAHPDAQRIGAEDGDHLAWTLVRDVDPTNADEICFRTEAFCALLSETALEAASPADFVERAVRFCNDEVWGSLSATVLCDPRSLRDATVGPAVERALEDLRYGSIGLNLWHAMSFAFASTVWGAYPGHARNDIQSGCGFVGNAYLFGEPEKSVVRGPFVARPDPAWFATNAHAYPVMRRLLRFQAAPAWRRLPGLLVAALR